MRKFTVFEIAKLLNYNDQEIDSLKTEFKGYTEETRCDVMDVFYDSFYELLNKFSKIKYDQFLAEASSGKREINSDLYQEAKRAVWKDFDEILAGKPQEKNEMEEIRNKLKFLTENAKKT
jgi:hypothetical protein